MSGQQVVVCSNRCTLTISCCFCCYCDRKRRSFGTTDCKGCGGRAGVSRRCNSFTALCCCNVQKVGMLSALRRAPRTKADLLLINYISLQYAPGAFMQRTARDLASHESYSYEYEYCRFRTTSRLRAKRHSVQYNRLSTISENYM